MFIQFCLSQAKEILDLGLKNVSFARKAVALNDGKNIADITWVKVSCFINVPLSYSYDN